MEYSFCFKTPHGKIQCEAETYEELIRLMRDSVSETVESTISELGFESHVKAFYDAFKSHFGRFQNGRSSIEINDLEMDLARCFLQRMTILQAMEWLKINRGFESSHSVIGRYWTRFSSLGFRRHSIKFIKHKG